MARQQFVKKKGVVLKVLGNAMYLVKDISSEEEVTVVISVKMRMNYLRLKVGQIICFEVSPYDSTRGRFVYK